jgi:hypothetical protein
MGNKCPFILFVALALCASVLPPLRAQDQTFPAKREDRELVFAFVEMVDSLRKQIVAESSDTAAASKRLKDAGMLVFGVTEGEFAIITDVCAEGVTKLEKLHREAVQYFDSERAAGRRPSNQTRAEFDNKRTSILADALQKLKQRLSPQAWDSVRSYINVRMRSRLVSTPLPAEK